MKKKTPFNSLKRKLSKCKGKLLGTLSILTLAAISVFTANYIFRPSPQQKDFNVLNQSELNNSAKQEKIHFTVSVVCGGHVECKKGTAPLKLAFKYLESRLNVKFTIKKIILKSDQPNGTIEERWQEWLEISHQAGASKNDLTVILLEDYPDNVDTFDFQTEGVIGLASGIGVLGGPAPAAILAKVMGSEKFMTKLLIHEVGHVLGAEHIEEGIMHPCACVNQYADELSIKSLDAIKAHLNMVRLYRTLKRLQGPMSNPAEPAVAPVQKASLIKESLLYSCK
jgi:hypothetical protein